MHCVTNLTPTSIPRIGRYPQSSGCSVYSLAFTPLLTGIKSPGVPLYQWDTNTQMLVTIIYVEVIIKTYAFIILTYIHHRQEERALIA